MWLTVRSGRDVGKRIRVSGERFVLGRDEGCALVINDFKVSRNHAYLEVLPSGELRVHDLGSTNGTFVNGQRVMGPLVVGENDEIRIGDTVLTASRNGEQAGPVSQAGPGERRRPGTATMERQVLRRSVRRATMLAGGAIAALAVVLLLFLTGVLPPGGGERSVAEIVEVVKPSTVLVMGFVGGEYAVNGTGWVLDAPKGLIVTNAHVVAGATDFAVGATGDKRPAEVVGVAPCQDLAVLRVRDTRGLKTLQLSSQSALTQGDTVVALGFPLNASLQDNLAATSGVVSVVREQFAADENYPIDQNVIQTTAQINPGNSGGPLVDNQGRLVGVNTSTLSGGELANAQNYAIGVDLVKQVVPSLARGRSLGWTGMNLDVDDHGNLLVTGAIPGTPAAKAGFDKVRGSGLVVIGINGKVVEKALRSYCDSVGKQRRGSTAAFTVTDGSRVLDVNLSFA